MKRTILTACIILGNVCMLTAQVKLQANNVDEVLKAMTLVSYKLSKQHTVKCHDVMNPSMPL